MRNSDKALIIAEVGQNHQGNFETALDYISIFSSQGADVIKFQTRDNRYLFSEDAYNKDYNSENAFAKNYGEHKFNLIVNMVKNNKESLQVYQTLTLVIEKFLGMDISLNYLGFIPYEEKFPNVVRSQKLITELFPESSITKSLEKIASQIEKIEVDYQAKGNIQFFFNKLIAI